MIQLHHFPGTAAMAPHILLEELGIPFELVHVDRTRDEHKSPDYLALNPNGLIPTLVDGDLVLFESAAICLHLADSHPEAGLAPAAGTPERAHLYKWLTWLTNTLQARLLVCFYPERWADDAAAIAQVRARAKTHVGAALSVLDAELARSGGPWLLGERFSVLDPYALMLCRWTRGFEHPAREHAQLAAYLQRGLERPATRRVFERENIAQPWV